MQNILGQRAWLLRLAQALVGDRDRAQDAVQETLAVALRHGVPEGRPAAPWLARVLRNAVRMDHRASIRRARREDEAASLADAAAPAPEQLLDRVRTHERLARAVLELPEPYRRTLLLRYEQELDTREIAQIEEVAAATVRWRIHQALDMLRARLDPEAHRGLRAIAAPLGAGPWFSGTSATTFLGGMIMKKTAGVLALALVAAAVVFVVSSPSPAEPPGRIGVETGDVADATPRAGATSSPGGVFAGGRRAGSDEVGRPGPPGGSRGPAPGQTRRAASFRKLYHHWDPAWVADNMRAGAEPAMLEESLDWLRARLGDCGEPAPMRVGSGQSRFLYPCERGELEVGFVEDDGSDRLRSLLLGARDVEPPAAVRRAAENALRLVDAWDPERFGDSFADAFDAEEMEAFFAETRETRGPCTLEGVDLANPRGALWFIACAKGPALMKTDLGDDDRIRVFFIQERRPLRPEP